MTKSDDEHDEITDIVQPKEYGATSASVVKATPDKAEPERSKGRKSKSQQAVAQRQASQSGQTKAEIVLKMLRSSKGATIRSLADATGWQMHSVRGFLSGTVKKKLGLKLVGEIGKDGARRYRVDAAVKAE